MKKETKKRAVQRLPLIQPQQFLHPITVLVLTCDGIKKDDEDTKQCARAIAESLKRQGHVVKKIIVTKKNWKKAIQTHADVVFNLVEDDGWKLYMKVGSQLETMKRAQVGHDRKVFRYVISKSQIKRNLKKHILPTPKCVIVNGGTDIKKLECLSFPLIVKPAREHAGIGISQKSVVEDMMELEKQITYIRNHFEGEIVVEEFIEGREIHVTVMGNGNQVHVLPLCEIGFRGKFRSNWDIYSYKAKWDKQSWEYAGARVSAPAEISSTLEKKIQAIAKRTYTAFECRDIVRLDFRIDTHNKPYVVDLNMSPSLNYYDLEDATLASVYALGWTYNQFIETLVHITYERVNGR
jgi:D-alanine-D-alanine ligase